MDEESKKSFLDYPAENSKHQMPMPKRVLSLFNKLSSRKWHTKGYLRRKGYERLNTGGRNRVVQLGSRRRRFWRIKLTLRLKFKFHFSPKKLLLRFRDAYVNMMMKIANSRMIGAYGSGSGFGMRPIKEYDERMIVDFYKSIVMAQQGKVVPRDAP